MDAIYLLVLVAVVAIAIGLARQDRETEADMASTSLPEFALPDFELESSFEFPYAFVRFARPEAPKLALERASDTERVIAEVRAALIESSGRVEIRDEEASTRVAVNAKRR